VGVFSADQSWPLGKVAIIPHRENAPRTQCRGCAGGGDINGIFCGDCDGRGWHDEHNPAPAERR
jgi:DnaJ-class molecular chaperone